MVAVDGGFASAAASMFSKTFTLADLLNISRNLRTSTYFTAASVVLLLYDYLLTLQDEVDYIWASKLSLPTVLFFVNRYVPIPVLLLGAFHVSPFHGPQSSLFCHIAILSQPIGETISYLAASWLLLLRVVALYQGWVILRCMLYAAFVLSHTGALVFVVSGLVPNWNTVFYSRILNICRFDDVKYFSGIYFALIPFELILMVLQVNHLIRHQHLLRPQSGTVTTQSRAAANLPHLLRTIYLDGSLYFFMVLALRLSAGLVIVYMGPSLFYMASWTEYSLSSLMVSRLFLHLRQVAARDPGNLPTTSTTNEESLTRFSHVDSKKNQGLISHEGKTRAPLSTVFSFPLSALPRDTISVGTVSKSTVRSFDDISQSLESPRVEILRGSNPAYMAPSVDQRTKPLPPIPSL